MLLYFFKHDVVRNALLHVHMYVFVVIFKHVYGFFGQLFVKQCRGVEIVKFSTCPGTSKWP